MHSRSGVPRRAFHSKPWSAICASVAEYRLLIKPSALKELDAVDSKRDRQRIINRIQALAGDPRPPKFDKMAGAASLFRVRQGQYRIVYAIDDTARTVDVIKIGHRREVYRRNA